MAKNKAQKLISKEISDMMREWKETGKITTSRSTYKPKTKKEALKQAAAIAYGKARQKGLKVRKKYKGSGVFNMSDIYRGYKVIK